MGSYPMIDEHETQLTVRKTSLFFSGDGFTVYDSNGQLIFRVDSYGPDSHSNDELILMDASGRCLITVHRKRPSLHNRWEGYKGEGTNGKKPIFSVKRSSIIGRSGVTVEVYGDGENSSAVEEYHIEGSFKQRFCTFLDSGKEIVAEIKRKVDVSTNMMLGKDVFSLCLKGGFDGALAMGLVLILDQIYGGDDDEDEDDEDGSGSSRVEPVYEEDH
ncbi:protein LURP-one-related 5-like [Impatiens glandulifera]|uniref:protein LURP-one-related 5-like n=1 Tax=Impatiens glandulifera TaxID=253017 RepID=UPI001FB0D485|nr:protein LURP-one-related 5-like [Impatiens glandulifera]